jgi:hypothetical protein
MSCETIKVLQTTDRVFKMTGVVYEKARPANRVFVTGAVPLVQYAGVLAGIAMLYICETDRPHVLETRMMFLRQQR